MNAEDLASVRGFVWALAFTAPFWLLLLLSVWLLT